MSMLVVDVYLARTLIILLLLARPNAPFVRLATLGPEPRALPVLQARLLHQLAFRRALLVQQARVLQQLRSAHLLV